MPNEMISLANAISESGKKELAYAADQLKLVKSVTSDAEARIADAAIKPAKTLVKMVHDQRMVITRRIDQFKKTVMAEETNLTVAINGEIERVTKLVVDYATAKASEEEARIQAERERIAREQAEADRAAMMEAELTGKAVVAPVVETVEQEPAKSKPVAGVSTRTVWTFEIVDPYAVPRAYCSPDERLIREFMNQAKAERANIEELSIPGVSFRKEIRV